MGVSSVEWPKIAKIAASWIVSPVLAGFIAYFLFQSVQKLILRTDDPLANARKYVPVYIFLVGFIMSLVTIIKGLKHLDLGLTTVQAYGISAGVGVITMVIGIVLISRLRFPESKNEDFRFANVEKIFGVLMIFTACGMAFAHGSNDVANAIGPVAAIVSVVQSGAVVAESALPKWVLLLGAGGIVFGLASYGFKVIQTVGRKITELTPSRGFAAELAAASTVVLASGTGLPISTTQTLVGAVLGVGFARGMDAINLRVVGSIFASWVVTLPAGGILAIIFFFIFRAIFGSG
jgi:PiT family inorganic phosphate transporter